MKSTKGIHCVFAVATAALLSVCWQAELVQGCISGRYGSYDKWPSSNDLEELLLLLTGKYGNNGYGWKDTNSYAYNSIGDYPYGTLKYSSSPFSNSDSGGSDGPFHSSYSPSSNSLSGGGWGGSYNGGSQYTSSAVNSKLNTDKIRQALNKYFKNKKPTTSSGGGWSGGSDGGGGFVGESFADSPGPGPPYNDNPVGSGPPFPSSHDSPGPPYPSAEGGPPSGPPSSFGPPSPSYETNSWPGGRPGSSGPGPSSPPGRDHGSSWPLPQEDGPGLGPHHHLSNPPKTNYDSISPNDNPLYSSQEGPPPPGNQFQSDYDTFGGGPPGGDYGKKRRRQGRRRSHTPITQQQQTQQLQQYQQQPLQQEQKNPQYRRRQKTAGLPTRPVKGAPGDGGAARRPYRFPPYPGPGSRAEATGGGGSRRGISRRGRKLGPPLLARRRLFLDTKFGGYKVDHSRIRSFLG